jgi:threonine dehydrogenase-like Zn-dependent dehydrogenase
MREVTSPKRFDEVAGSQPSPTATSAARVESGDNSATPFPEKYKSVEICPDGPSLVEHPFPHLLDDNTVVVKPILVGICRSDLKELMRARTVRHDFGHEILGEVGWAGRALGLERGDTVCFDPHVGVERTSGFGEYFIARGDSEALGRAFVKIPSETSAEKSVFCEPMACAHHCVANLMRYLKCESLANLRVAVIGAGNAGALLSLLAKHLGASVTLFNRNAARLEFLKRKGIFSTHELCLIDRRRPPGFDAVIAATTFLYPSVLSFAMQCLNKEAILMLYGGTREGDLLAGAVINIDQTRRREALVSATWLGKQFRVGGTYGALSIDFARVAHLLKTYASDFPVELLISHQILLAELPEVLRFLTKPETQQYGKIVVRGF